MANNSSVHLLAPVQAGDKVTVTDKHGMTYLAVVHLVTSDGSIVLKLGSK